MTRKMFACSICGAPNKACEHKQGVAVMTKGRAATLAIAYAFSFVDEKKGVQRG